MIWEKEGCYKQDEVQILEKNQDFKGTLPLGDRDGDAQGSILTEASREQQGLQELRVQLPNTAQGSSRLLHFTA